MEIDNIFGPIDIAISGMRAQDKHIEILTSNVVNARSTDGGDGEPYRRLAALFKTDGEGISGVHIEEILPDMSAFPMKLDPSHPQANKQGYVAMPNVNLPIEMMNLNLATRAYQANAAILKRYQKMIETSLELLR